jgi:hypothetical protein
MISTTCRLKWVNEFQHEFLSQLIVQFTLGITLGELMAWRAVAEVAIIVIILTFRSKCFIYRVARHSSQEGDPHNM